MDLEKINNKYGLLNRELLKLLKIFCYSIVLVLSMKYHGYHAECVKYVTDLKDACIWIKFTNVKVDIHY